MKTPLATALFFLLFFSCGFVQGSGNDAVLRIESARVFLEPAQTVSIPITVENNSDKRNCFEIQAELDNDARGEIEARIHQEKFCLAKSEQTTFSLTISALKDARTGNYFVPIKLEPQIGGVEKETVEVEVVDGDEPIDVKRSGDYFLCTEPYTQEIKVRLENNSARKQTIELHAENDILLPRFEFAKTGLQPGEEEEMKLIINTNNTTSLTEHKINVTARSENYFVKRQLVINLVDCSEEAFFISIEPSILRIKRVQEKEFVVSIKNNLKEEQEVHLSAQSDLHTELPSEALHLAGNSSKKVKLTLSAAQADSLGSHIVEVLASSKGTQKSASAEVKIEAEKETPPIQPEQASDVIEITNYPVQITLHPMQERTLDFTIKNPLQQEIRGVQARVLGTGNSASARSVNIGTLRAGESRTFTMQIKAMDVPERTVPTTLEVAGDNYITAREIEIAIRGQTPDNGTQGNTGTGLFGLAPVSTITLGLLIVAVILLIAYSSYKAVYEQ